MYRILVVDDHEIIRDAMRYYFEGDTNYQVAAEAENGVVALAILEKDSFDVVLTDINMPEMDGLSLVSQIRRLYPEQRILVLSMFNEAPYINKVIAMGANGYVLKKAPKEELVKAIEKVLSGDNFFSQDVTNTIIGSIAKRSPKKRLTFEIDLSDREKEVLSLIVNEHSNQEISEKLFISVRTVEAHKRNILEKTGCKNIAGLVMYAVERGLV